MKGKETRKAAFWQPFVFDKTGDSYRIQKPEHKLARCDLQKY